jgi:prepilin-type N-terminal cleavage/methylation domain-containing protein
MTPDDRAGRRFEHMARGSRTHGSRAGYTLVELMIVVTILGILATIAVPLYKGYIYRSKASEAIGFLNEIKQRQEAYRADFRQYLNVSGTVTNWWPDANPGGSQRAWPTEPMWNFLGAQPPGRSTYFSYVTVAGPPGTDPSFFGADSSLGYAGDDYWFIARALGNLDDDGEFITFEAYSESQNIWESNPQGWE